MIFDWKAFDECVEKEYVNMTGISVQHRGKVIYSQSYHGYDIDNKIHIASVTKSIMSLLIGIAIDKGYIKSIDQKVLEFFPDYKIKRGEKTIQDVTIKHLMTMTAPYKYKYEPYTKVYSTMDWVQSTLDLLGGRKPIGTFKYTTIGVHILSGILNHATEATPIEFANQYLFEPLGIKGIEVVRILTKEAHIDFIKNKGQLGWVTDHRGLQTAGWGLTLNLEDMIKIGSLYLNDGIYDGKEIISKKWINLSTSKHSDWDGKSYGLMWWILDDEVFRGYAAIGDGGNIIYICPDRELVIAITSSFRPMAKDRFDLIKNFIIDVLERT